MTSGSDVPACSSLARTITGPAGIPADCAAALTGGAFVGQSAVAAEPAVLAAAILAFGQLASPPQCTLFLGKDLPFSFKRLDYTRVRRLFQEVFEPAVEFIQFGVDNYLAISSFGVVVEVILMVAFGRIKFIQRLDFGDDLSVPDFLSLT